MSDFLSNLIARSFNDAPVIQPRLPSLFETAADEFFDEPQSSTPTIAAPERVGPEGLPTPVQKLSPVAETATEKSIASVSEGSLPEPDTPTHGSAPVIAQTRRASEQKLEIETKRIIVPVDSFRDRKKDAGNTVHPGHRKDFSPVEQRSSASSPIIRVTIGRVEVRAIHSPAPAPKPAKPAPPKLSLEDYLHRRERGSR